MFAQAQPNRIELMMNKDVFRRMLMCSDMCRTSETSEFLMKNCNVVKPVKLLNLVIGLKPIENGKPSEHREAFLLQNG